MSDVGVPRKLQTLVSSETLDVIASAVKLAESQTSGEIVVHIVRNLLPLETARGRARRIFNELGVEKTQNRNGILLLVVLKKRLFEILADEGIDKKTSPDEWESIAERISECIERDGLAEGIRAGVEQIGKILSERFPSSGAEANVLPDRPSVDPG